MTCFLRQFAPEQLGECDGKLTQHHVISRMRLARVFPNGAIRVGNGWVTFDPRSDNWADYPRTERRTLHRLRHDGRNLVPVCWYHHQLFENARIEVPSEAWPKNVWQFAKEYGLEWDLERRAVA